MADDEGVLGNLPHSRPGKRSAKRDSGGGPAKAAGRAAAKAEAGGKPAAKAPRASKPRARAKPAAGTKAGAGAKPASTAKPGAGPDAGRRQPADPPRPQPSADAVAGVVRTAATVAATGVRVASAVTQEILRRLPRP
jgi:hypothetical protein